MAEHEAVTYTEPEWDEALGEYVFTVNGQEHFGGPDRFGARQRFHDAMEVANKHAATYTLEEPDEIPFDGTYPPVPVEDDWADELAMYQDLRQGG